MHSLVSSLKTKRLKNKERAENQTKAWDLLLVHSELLTSLSNLERLSFNVGF